MAIIKPEIIIFSKKCTALNLGSAWDIAVITNKITSEHNKDKRYDCKSHNVLCHTFEYTSNIAVKENLNYATGYDNCHQHNSKHNCDKTRTIPHVIVHLIENHSASNAQKHTGYYFDQPSKRPVADSFTGMLSFSESAD